MNFEAKRLGDVAEIVGGGTPPTKDASNWDGDIPWLTPKDLSSFEGIYVDRGSRSITEKGFKSSSAKMLPAGAVLYTSRAPIGYVAIANNSISTNQGFKSLILKDGYVPEFVFYLLKASKSEIESHASGGTFAEISAKALSNVVLQFPPKVQQEAIAKILLSLDGKITANNALSKTLEDIAQTIFKSWFIDFDPVKAKMAGEKPAGMDAATAALFPDTMEESELALIPKGWAWGTVGDIAYVIDCLHAKKPELIDQGKPYLQLDTISDAGVLKFENAAKISESDYEKWTSRIEVIGGDCLITNVGRVGAVSQVPDHFKAAIGRNITAIRPKDFTIHKSFLVTALLSNFMKKEILRNTDSGTILEALNVKTIPNLRVPIPSDEVFQLFENFCGPFRQLLNALHQQSVQLRLTRDALLPRLISGELQIPEEMLVS
jgi:type I restriction enzyme S subunit